MKLSLALQRSLISVLRSDAPLTTLLGGAHIYDAPPHAEQGLLPHIILGDDSISNWPTKDSDGAEHTIMLTIWSDGQGYSEVKSIMAALYNAVEENALAIDGGQVISLRFLSARTSRESAGRLRRALCRFRVLVEHDAPR